MLAIARIELGISEKEFWSLTPAKFFAFRAVRQEQSKQEDYRSGLIAAIIEGALGKKDPQPLDHFGGTRKRATGKTDSAQEMASKFQAYIALQKKGKK